jgi:hypothetical protein
MPRGGAGEAAFGDLGDGGVEDGGSALLGLHARGLRSPSACVRRAGRVACHHGKAYALVGC